MHKKVIFLDGDGTLWYPKATQRTRKPHWVYHDETTKSDYLAHLELTPGTKEALEQLYARGVRLVVVSANPLPEEEAVKEIKDKLQYFGIFELFYAYRSSEGSDPLGKVHVMEAIIEELGLSKEDALMVGDSYFYDYVAARDNGIDALFIDNTVSRMPEVVPQDIRKINEVRDIIKMLH